MILFLVQNVPWCDMNYEKGGRGGGGSFNIWQAVLAYNFVKYWIREIGSLSSHIDLAIHCEKIGNKWAP